MMAVVALILIGVAVAVANADSGMPDAPRDLAETGIPADRPMTPDDVQALRFSMAPRGYRMGEVDEAIARLREELAVRDAEIERLRNPEWAGLVDLEDLVEQEQLEEILELHDPAATDEDADADTDTDTDNKRGSDVHG